jgi:hypothetical protein
MHGATIKEKQMVIEFRNLQNRGNFFTSRGIVLFSRETFITEKIKSANNRLSLHAGFS